MTPLHTAAYAQALDDCLDQATGDRRPADPPTRATRGDLVLRCRALIDTDAYETEDRLAAAVDRLAASLN